MKKLLLCLILSFVFSINSYSQEKFRMIYIETISTKVTPYSDAIISFQGCDHPVIEDTQVAFPGFKGYDFTCDSVQFAAYITFSVSPNNQSCCISYSVTNGDLKYVDGDSIIVNLDKHEATIINKDRPNRRK
jgi:hypothetical protein